MTLNLLVRKGRNRRRNYFSLSLSMGVQKIAVSFVRAITSGMCAPVFTDQTVMKWKDDEPKRRQCSMNSGFIRTKRKTKPTRGQNKTG